MLRIAVSLFASFRNTLTSFTPRRILVASTIFLSVPLSLHALQIFLDRYEARLRQKRIRLIEEEEEWAQKTIDGWANIIHAQALLVLYQHEGQLSRLAKQSTSMPESIRDIYHRLGLLDSMPRHPRQVACENEIASAVEDLRELLKERRRALKAGLGTEIADIRRLIRADREEVKLWIAGFGDESELRDDLGGDIEDDVSRN